ncbi:hypothetical protein H9650_02825 [Psychrobacillus sp. Sa2BUA9]|uniref:DUF86 domain-containing protein n=1 Tax=Psychrobacillus faecigallinarum TaxID=2762235 RepID=A0ABR8R5G5_9BACI|nr:hypothetical protein [Psychrobacillus faecigallinarum]MBD7943038.1 hypothetical protein [Psychrobacillus faecigallinarum]
MNKLVEETIESYNEYLSILPKGCQKIADDIRQTNLNEALKEILAFSEGVSWLISANVNLEKYLYYNPLNTEKIHVFLNEINSGLEIQDYVIVADMFEYEIKPFFEKCQTY